jgi:dolichol-phosphate mannosyltransferase
LNPAHFVSVVVPTLNERGNIPALLDGIAAVLSANGISGEVIVVDDDSADGTAEAAREKTKDGLGRVISRRSGPMGLSASVLEGFAAAGGSIVGVMDADMSHPPDALPRLIAPLVAGKADVAVGSRYIAGGATRGWPARRIIVSRIACLLCRSLCGLSDGTSGFFFFRREILGRVRLKPAGWKIGLELFANARNLRIVEIPYEFRVRRSGKSKFGAGPALAFMRQILRLSGF